MTNKTEDRFYFGKPGQPEKFDRDIPIKSWTRGSTKYEAGITEDAGRFQPYVNMPESGILVTRSAPTFKTETGARKWLESYMQKMNASRPGQPERFDASSVSTDGLAVTDAEYQALSAAAENQKRLISLGSMADYTRNSNDRAIAERANAALAAAKARNDAWHKMWEQASTASEKAKVEKQAQESERGMRRWKQQSRQGFARPGQPEKFDASSLDRKGFAAASSSPMLGKLLSEKQMPEGGWRAVETGGNALVISFEDGDVAGNFARRVASHGYSATAPVQSIGRYWNVEVKNG
jgi:hypothetical protein